MAKERIINTHFWDDTYIVNLDPIEKLLFLYFLTNPITNICGIYEIPLRRVAFDTGIDSDMIKKIISRFAKDKKIFYLKEGFIFITNFTKHQHDNPSVRQGIKRSFDELPTSVQQAVYKLSPSSIQAGTLNLTKLNLTKPTVDDETSSRQPVKKVTVDVNGIPTSETNDELSEIPFSFKEEVGKLENSPSRTYEIVGLYLKHRKPDLQDMLQLKKAINRHKKPAKELSVFSNNQILNALDKAQRDFPDIYTLETLLKILTK